MGAPERIGRYRIDRLVGSGGFATVWLARDEVLDAPVAVKVLADNWAHQLDVRERFLEEARILRRADSDRVVRVHDIGELDDGRPYFVMTYADGGTLADLVAGGPVPMAAALRYGAEVARGLAVLHEVGVIHRDVNPANVLLRSDRTGADRVLVADLGLAKAAAHASGITMTVGTPGYMAPEQSSGAGLSTRADVYAVGALLHHLLSGRAPTADGLPPLPAGVPAPVSAVVEQAVRRRPEERYPSAGALAEALDNARIASSAPPARTTASVARNTAAGERTPASGERATTAGERSAAGERTTAQGRTGAAGERTPATEERTTAADGRTAPADARTTRTAPASRDERAVAAAERAAEPDDTMELRRPVRRRWGRLLVSLVLVLLAGGAGALAAWRLWLSPTVRVTGEAVTLSVPREWATERKEGANQGMTGLLVTRDVDGWSATSGTPGVWVGVGPGTLTTLPRGPATTCRAVAEQLSAAGLSGTLKVYRDCAAVGTGYAEAVLKGPDHVVVVQIKGDEADARAVLASLTLR